MAERSSHVPHISKYRSPSPAEALHVVFLQRMTEVDQEQVLRGLRDIDAESVRRLNVAQLPAPRRLEVKKWIRDFFPSSATILEIAKAAHSQGSRGADPSYSSIVFVDSGWDLGNAVATHWERDVAGEGLKLSAARVPMGIANVLLTACDRIEDMTLQQALGHEAFQQARVDFYADLPDRPQTTVPVIGKFEWPSHLPKDLQLHTSHPVIISLRRLEDAAIATLKQEILDGEEGSSLSLDDIEVHNWEGPEPTSRQLIRDMHQYLTDNMPESKKDGGIHAFFVDYMLQGPSGEPQILAVSEIGGGKHGVEVLPVFTSKFLAARKFLFAGGKTTYPRDMSEEAELFDIWRKEHVQHLNFAGAHIVSACPIFFLRPFSQEEERRIRDAICALGDVEHGQDWGHLFNWHGYIFSDGKTHTLEDLRDLFECADPNSPFFDATKAGPYRLPCYPSNFCAVDDKVFDPEQPKVWMASTLDFSGEDSFDCLGWIYGRLDACQTSIIFVNLDIANSGPDECFDEGTVDRLWLSDLKAYKEEDWDENAEW